MHRQIAFALACVAALTPAAAERAATFAESFADAAPLFGHWRLWPDVEDSVPDTDCRIELLPTHASEQFQLTLGPECAARFPFVKDVTGWQAGFQAIDFVNAAGQVRLSFIGRGPDWMISGEEVNGQLVKYGMSLRAPDYVTAASGEYSFTGEGVPAGACTLRLGDWNAPLVDGAKHPAWEVLPNEGCRVVPELTDVVAWRPQMEGGVQVIVLYTADTTERARFAPLEGAEDAMSGTIGDTTFKLTKKS